jgi:hypothetical protein
MRILPLPPEDSADRRMEVGARVADRLADALARGPRAALQTARSLSDEELRYGLEFVTTVLDIAASSARALATVQTERGPNSPATWQ